MAIPWAKVHGAITHFPIALSAMALLFDASAVTLWRRPVARSLCTAGFWTVALAAGGGVTAVISGLILARGEFWGTGDLGLHHRFVWPAFALLVGAATWRTLTHRTLTRPAYFAYVGAMAAAAVLVAGAGYAGGEMLQGLP